MGGQGSSRIEIDVIAESRFRDVEAIDEASFEEGAGSDNGVDGVDGGGCGGSASGDLGFDVVERETKGLGRGGLVVFEVEVARVQVQLAIQMEGKDGGGIDFEMGVR